MSAALQRHIADKFLTFYNAGKIWQHGGLLYGQLLQIDTVELFRLLDNYDCFSDLAYDKYHVIARPKKKLLDLIER